MLDLKIATDGDHCAGCNTDLTGSGTIAVRNDKCYCRKCIASGQVDSKTARPIGLNYGERPAVQKIVAK